MSAVPAWALDAACVDSTTQDEIEFALFACWPRRRRGSVRLEQALAHEDPGVDMDHVRSAQPL